MRISQAQQSTVQDCPRIIRRKTTTDLPTCGSRYSLTRTGASRPYSLTSMIAVPVSHMVLYWWYWYTIKLFANGLRVQRAAFSSQLVVLLLPVSQQVRFRSHTGANSRR